MPVARIHKTGSPYNAAEFAEMDFEQTADVLYFAHENHVPTKLIRNGHYSWTFSDVAFGPSIAFPASCTGSATVANTDAPNSGNAYFPQPATYCVTAVNEDTGQESRASNTVTMTNDLGLKRNYNSLSWSAVAGATTYRVYKQDNSQLFGHIGTTINTTFRDDNIGPDLSEGPPIGDNPFVGAGNYPSAVTFHEQRSVWGRTLNRPNAIFASRSADYENMDFTRPSRADDAFVIGLVANKVNSVNQLVSFNKGLIALTSHNIFSIQGANEDYIAASPPPRIRPEISRGASRLNPVVVDNVVFYETSKGGDVRTIGYEYELDGIRTDDLTIFSRHLFENQDIVAWAWLEKPGSCLLLVRGDGVCLCLTWDQAQQVFGWTIYETDGLFKDVVCITEQGEDRAYFLIERTIGGVAKVYVERMASDMWTDQKAACFLDCAKTYLNDGVVSYADHLEHLEGRTVSAWVDGQALTGLVVTNGRVDFPTGVAGATVTVGLPFTATIETLPLAMQTGAGWTVARPQHLDKVILRVVNSRNIIAGPDMDQLFDVKQRELENYGDPIALMTGDMEVNMAGTSGAEPTVIVVSSDPTPLHIAAILIEPSGASSSV